MQAENRDKFLEELKNLQNESPYYRLLGMRVEEIGDGHARLALRFRDELCGRRGVMHGGALASLADGAMAIAILSKLGPGIDTASIEFKINYIAPATSGEVVADGRAIHVGRTIAVAESDVRLLDGKLVARCLGTYIVLRREKS